jgi:hypothetical protein
MFYLIAFMNIIYPRVPVQFGGGQSIPVQFLIKHESVKGVSSLGLSFPASEDLTDTTFLTYQDEKSYVVTLTTSPGNSRG